MNTLIETPFFFLHQKLDKFRSITLSKKFTYIIAPLLPITSLIVSLALLPYFYNLSKWYILLPIVAFICSILLLTASINFYKGQNIFLISNLNLIYKQSFKSFQNSTEYLLSLPVEKIISIDTAPIEKEKKYNKDNVFTFCITHDTIIKETLYQLKKEVINDDTTVEDFKRAILYCIIKHVGHICKFR